MSIQPIHDALNDTLSQVGRLEIRARRVVDGFLSGRHKSPYRGRSLDFREHRQYAHGDDLRDVDWKVWGRQDRLYVKQFEAETNLRATLLVDVSASMSYSPPKLQNRKSRPGQSRLSKHQFATTAACAISYLLTRQHDSVGCLTFANKIVNRVPPRNSRTQLNNIAEALALPPMGAKTDLEQVLLRTASRLKGRGLLVLISDLLAPPEQLSRGLAALRSRGTDLLVLHIMDDDELDFPFEGPSCFVGLETSDELNVNPRALRLDYLDALERHLDAVRSACATQQADYRLIRTSDPLESALVALLGNRA